MSHTPGPWKLKPCNNLLEVKEELIRIHRGKDEGRTFVFLGSDARDYADATLAAAAPALLRSLTGCLAIIKDELAGIIEAHCLDDEDSVPIRSTLDELCVEDVEDYEGVVADIERVIAQAEGRSL